MREPATGTVATPDAHLPTASVHFARERQPWHGWPVAGAAPGRSPADGTLVERGDELNIVRRFVTRHGPASALLVTGEAGIGKSTIWGLGVAAAIDAQLPVLSTRAADAEAGLSFAGLSDLLERVDADTYASLPEVQRDALDSALLRSGKGTAPSPRAIGAATVSVLRSIVQPAGALIAIDDLQWLDAASTDVLGFALRRVTDLPIRLLATVRTPSALTPPSGDGADRLDALRSALPPGTVETLTVPPLNPDELGAAIERRLGHRLPARTVDDLHRRTGGNPFWALEVVRSAAVTDLPDRLHFPESLSSTVATRLRALDADVQAVLTTVSALLHPSVALVTAALDGMVDDPSTAIDAAVSAGVVEDAGSRLRPAHPVLGSVALQLLPPARRAGLHRRLAAVVGDPEQRARHLAAATEGAESAEVAAALDAGAMAAQARGAMQSAIELAELAITSTPHADAAAIAARQLGAAAIHYSAGRPETALELAARAARGGETPVRVSALCLLGQITYYRDGSGTARDYLHRALAAAGDDRLGRARALAALSDMADLGARRDLHHAEEALALLSDATSVEEHEIRRAALLASVGAQLDLAMGLDEGTLSRAAQSEAVLVARGVRPVGAERVAFQTSWWFKIVDQLDRSRTAIQAAIQAAFDEGIESELPNLFGHLALTECWAGRFPAAQVAVEEGVRHAAVTGWSPTALYGAAGLVEALGGRTEAARQTVRRDLAFGEVHGHPRAVVAQLHVLGLADLLDGDHESAAERLSAAYDLARENDIHEPGRRHRLEPDLGQAWLAVGRLDDAAALAQEQIDLGTRMGRAGPLAIGLRLAGLVQAAQGELTRAEQLVTQAVATAEAAPFPLEVGRTYLALGQVQRRARAKQRARDSVGQARAIFERIGSPPWQAMADAELRRVGGAHTGDALTATEQRVAELAAAGGTNREIAAALFTSVRTVEGHLAAVYRKLGVRGRVALAQHLNSAGQESR